MGSARLLQGLKGKGWRGLFGAAGGVAAEIVSRMSNLESVICNNAPKRILNLFPRPKWDLS